MLGRLESGKNEVVSVVSARSAIVFGGRDVTPTVITVHSPCWLLRCQVSGVRCRHPGVQVSGDKVALV